MAPPAGQSSGVHRVELCKWCKHQTSSRYWNKRRDLSRIQKCLQVALS